MICSNYYYYCASAGLLMNCCPVTSIGTVKKSRIGWDQWRIKSLIAREKHLADEVKWWRQVWRPRT